ncbi:MAG: hypothetical protein K6F01_08370 [Selenomonas sp.]|uniref:hypothetical protein n=1 Tax=Selenomonas sp. TaxID=2053611 RepID=UPI0025D449DB|nr:hypothetical protein [Selenomonas sp.]MCR5439427.1 hypothetical protein [Selenomonas sp.]
MEIQATKAVLWNPGAAETESSKRDKTPVAKPTFSHMLRQLETGGGIRDTGEGDNGEETTTVTQVMSDGSVLVTIYAGDRIVSQSKTHAAHPEENPTILSTQVEKSGQAIPAEAEKMASAETAALMMNALGKV